jgi:uncharacterized membrane protein
MFNQGLTMKIAKETHLRTVAKTVIYRILSIIVTMALTLVFGGSMLQAVQFGLVSLIIGSTHFYVYDRIWQFIPWQRSVDGHDTKLRSIVKAIIYRITVILVLMVTARMIFADSNLTAFLVATTKFIINTATYYVLERVFNRTTWGLTEFKNSQHLG